MKSTSEQRDKVNFMDLQLTLYCFNIKNDKIKFYQHQISIEKIKVQQHGNLLQARLAFNIKKDHQ